MAARKVHTMAEWAGPEGRAPCENCGASVRLVDFGGTRHFRGRGVKVACSLSCAVAASKKGTDNG